jgi:hypothetical protein
MSHPNPGNTGNRTHDDAVTASEASRQSAAKAAGASQATVKAADIAHYRNVVASAKLNGLPYEQATIALMELGTGGT